MQKEDYFLHKVFTPIVFILLIIAFFLQFPGEELSGNIILQAPTTLEVSFREPRADGSSSYYNSDTSVDLTLFSPEKKLVINSLILKIDGTQQFTSPEVITTPEGSVVHTRYTIPPALPDGKHEVDITLQTNKGSKTFSTSFLVDYTAPHIVVNPSQGLTQKLVVTDNRNVAYVRAFAYTTGKFIRLTDPTKISPRDYSFTRSDASSWKNIVYLAGDGLPGNYQMSLAYDSAGGPLEGESAVYNNFAPNPGDETEELTAGGGGGGSDACVYRARIVVPYLYYSGIFNTSKPSNKAAASQKVKEKMNSYVDLLEEAIALLSDSVASQGYAPIKLEITGKSTHGFAVDYWTSQNNSEHPYFYSFFDSIPSSVQFTGASNDFIPGPFYSKIPVDPYDPLAPEPFPKKQDYEEVMVVVDKASDPLSGVVAQTYLYDGFILAPSNKDWNPPNMYPFIIPQTAHEIGHSLGLDHSTALNNLMCTNVGGLICDFTAQLTKDQARAISGHLCGLPPEKLNFEAIDLWQNPEFGVNKLATEQGFICGNGKIGDADQCENAFYNLGALCPKPNPEQKRAVWPDIKTCVADESGKNCICKLGIPPTSGAGAGGAPTLPPGGLASPPPNPSGALQSATSTVGGASPADGCTNVDTCSMDYIWNANKCICEACKDSPNAECKEDKIVYCPKGGVMVEEKQKCINCKLMPHPCPPATKPL